MFFSSSFALWPIKFENLKNEAMTDAMQCYSEGKKSPNHVILYC